MEKQKLTRKQKLESVKRGTFVMAATYLVGMLVSMANAIFSEDLNFVWWLVTCLFFLAMLIAWAVGVVIGFLTDKP